MHLLISLLRNFSNNCGRVFWENSSWLKSVNYFCEKSSPKVFGSVLNTTLIAHLSPHSAHKREFINDIKLIYTINF